MRVAIVAHGVTDQSLLGGPGRVAAQHAAELAKRGNEVMIVTTDLIWKGRRAAKPTFDLLGGGDIEVRCASARSLQRWPGSIGPIYSLGAARMLSEAVRWADVVHAHEWPHSLTQGARRACHRYGKPFVVQPHGSVQRRTGLHRALHAGVNFINRPAAGDRFLAGTQQEAEEIRAVLGSEVDVGQLVNPIALPVVDPASPQVRHRRDSWGFAPSSRVILYAHRIAPNKGLDLAVEALQRLPPSYVLVVAGAEPPSSKFGEHCRTLARSLGVDSRVSFVGPVSRAEIDELIFAADTFLLPARRDTFPLMVLHAMACGRPVVVTRGCQSVEVLEDAVIVCEPTSAGIAAGIADVSRTDVGKLGQEARSLIERKFTSNAVGDRLEAIYASSLRTIGAQP